MPVAKTEDVAMPFLLMGAFRNLVDAVHRDLAEGGFSGVRPTHGFAMQAIGSGCTSVELARRLGVSKQAANKTAQGLEALGLLERHANRLDRRERVLTPTARGHEMLRLSAVSFRRELRRWRGEVGDDHVEATLVTLARVGSGGRSLTDLSDWT